MMAGGVIKVNVKWNKEKFQDVELDTAESPIVFKSQLFALSGVEPDRQKVVIAGKTIDDTTDWSTVKLKDGMLIMMMGTKAEDQLAAAPKEAVKFVEDMDMDAAPAIHKPGLVNLGNTCYLNATLQCLRTVPELHQALVNYAQPAGMDGSSTITAAAAKLWKELDRPQAAVTPVQFVATLKQVFPRFATRDDHGHPQQQDAQECWIELLNCLGQKLPGKGANGKSMVQQYFSSHLESKISCPEAPEEASKTEVEDMLLLSCNISQETNHLTAGIKLQLNGTLEKFSPALNRNAVYNKVSKIARLPAYLSVQYLRFYWKAAAKTNAKVLRNVKFPLTLDMYEFCTEELRQKLTPMRKRFEAQAQREVDERAKLKDLEKDKDAEAVKKVKLAFEFEDDPGSNNSGYYELAAVLTHKGRSSDSGHYVGWVRNPDRKGEWLQYDDDKVSPVEEDKVLQLSGGGDWHMAYILLYAPKVLEESPEPAQP